MASIFYKAMFERPFPVTLLFLELLQTELNKDPDAEFTEAEIVPVIRGCIVAAGLCEKATKRDAEYVLKRLTEMMEQAKAQKDSPPPSKKQTFASSYSNWALDLPPDGLCLAASGYDYEKAAHLYRTVDKEDVLWLADKYLRHEWEKIKVGFESVVYGFGGSYKGDSGAGGGGGTTYDLTKDSNEGLAALKKLL